MAGRRSRRARRRGFTLIEVMVSLGIMTVGAMAMIALQQHTIRSNSHARQLAIATHIAQQWIERIKQDAHTWNTVGTNVADVQAALSRTLYLNVVATAARGQFVSPPAPNVAAPFVSNIYDFRGTPLPQDDGSDAEGLTYRSRIFFCTSYRTNWVYFGRAARVDVRVWWPRENSGANIDDDFQGWCQDAPNTFGPGGLLNGMYHVVYLSTVVRMVPVTR